GATLGQHSAARANAFRDDLAPPADVRWFALRGEEEVLVGGPAVGMLLPSESRPDTLGQQGHPIITTSRVRGPCTPSTRSSSMSDVADGPLIIVIGRSGTSRASASGTPTSTSLTATTHTCRSGTSVNARRPWSGLPSRKIVPVSAQVTAEAV